MGALVNKDKNEPDLVDVAIELQLQAKILNKQA